MKFYLKMLAVILLSVFSLSAFADDYRYTIYVDAGSTSSKLHIFQYKSGSIPEVKDIFSDSVSPGLSSAENPGASLKKVLDEAQQFLTGKAAAGVVPVNVYGTAGMRMLLPEKQKLIYNSVTDYLAKYPFFAKGDVRTISGKMEGVYGWIDVNYLNGTFLNQKPTVGSIDMGGASTQIAYAIPNRQVSDSENEVTLTIHNQPYTVFSQSFLGLGQSQSIETMMQDPNASVCFPKDDEFSPSKMGAYHFASCTDLFKHIIASYHVPEHLLPMKDQYFVAYSGIYYTLHFLNVDTTPDHAVVESMINAVCYQNWDDLKKAHPTEKETYLSAYCAAATYENELLYKTYRLQGYQMKVVNQLNGTPLDWTLGAIVYSLIEG
jgi:apyrase